MSSSDFDDFKIEWTKGQPKNLSQLSLEISRLRGKLHNVRDEKGSTINNSDAISFRYGALCIIDQLHRMLDAHELFENDRKLREIQKIIERQY